MSKLVDKERLAKLAKALDERAKAAAAQAEANAKAHAEEKDEVLAGRIQTLEGLVVGGEGEGLEAVIGDVAQNKADIAELKEFKEGHSHDEFAKQADLEEVEGIAQAAKGAIDVFMAAADVQEGAIDTLKEIQAYIESDGAAAEEMLANIAAAQKAADDEKVRAEAEEAKIREEMADELGNFAYRDEEEVFHQATGLRKEIADKDNEIRLQAEKYAQDEVTIARRLISTEIEEMVGYEEDRALEQEAAIREEFAAADAALKLELQAEIDADVKLVADDLALEKAKIVALQEFQAGHDHAQMEGDIEELQEAMANKVEQGAIDAAVEGLISEDAVKAMLGNVVSSLSLAIVENKVKLSLGSEADGIAIAEVELDMAVDADIDEIIAGLDEE